MITGGISAEHGGKPVAVIAMTTRSGLATPNGFEGDVTFGAASQRTGELAFTARGGGDTRGFFVTGATSTSDRFLDPATFDNLHNTGRTGRLFTRFDQILSDQDTLRLTVSGGRTFRDVVNLPSQQAAGQNQRVATGDLNLSLAWQHVLTPDQSLEATVFQRRATARLDPTRELQPGFTEGGPDSPVWARQDRVLENRGALLSWTKRSSGGSTFKAGLQAVSFPLQERFHFALTRNGLVDTDAPLYAYSPAGGGAIWHFQDAMTPTLASAYVQNDLHLGEAFLALGLRYDRWQLRGEAVSDLQPRLGASWRIRETGTILRASFDRLFITPDRENLALSMSHEAAELGESHEGETSGHDHGLHRVRPEVQKAWTVGLEQQLGSWGRVMIERWAAATTPPMWNSSWIPAWSSPSPSPTASSRATPCAWTWWTGRAGPATSAWVRPAPRWRAPCRAGCPCIWANTATRRAAAACSWTTTRNWPPSGACAGSGSAAGCTWAGATIPVSWPGIPTRPMAILTWPSGWITSAGTPGMASGA